ncbi:MAG: hypothetical protein NWF00_04185 [Candidatus Bathyarchaeota archaeon]|nr:hypothetical protein [Candidatus Bathyarchaeota archaeon]
MRKHAFALFSTFLISAMLITSLSLANAASPFETLNQAYTDDFSTDSGFWTYLGSAHWDSTNQSLVLTEPVCSQGGAAFFKVPFTGSFTANFSYMVGGGSGGDGFAMFFYKQQYPLAGESPEFSLIRDGESLGFSQISSGVSGYGIEFDEFQNYLDPSGDHIALIKDWAPNHLVYTNDNGAEDNIWHNASVIVGDSYVGVFVDNAFVLRWDGIIDRSFDWFGFCGATGAATNWHIIDNFSLTPSAAELPPTPPSAIIPTPAPTATPPLPSAFISISADASSSTVGSTVNVNGRLTDPNGSALGTDKTVILSHAVGGVMSWFPIGSGQTDGAGEYAIQWVPAASGTFTLKTEWKGDSNYSGAANSTTLSLLPYQNQKVFCVESNSTVTGLEFSDLNQTLAFTVSDPAGTTGYTQVTIAKTLASNIDGITTTIDGKPVNFKASSVNENWIVEFAYSHSTHQVSINLQNQQKELTKSTTANSTPPVYPALLVTAVCVAALLTAIMKKNCYKK